MDEAKNASPRILSIAWGRMEIEKLGRGKDFKLWPGGGRSWNWSEHGTEHSPGIAAGDCEELVERGCRVVVLSRGMNSRLQVTSRARSYLEENGIEVIMEETARAVETYNTLAEQGRAVGGLFHSTC